ncbi:MAG TPA: polysaccharide biosynthesis/export family protein [Armatimonadota bacterium]|nr:polysaccharide biosynthesis/export family protein [Armatimonadota bacterium]
MRRIGVPILASLSLFAMCLAGSVAQDQPSQPPTATPSAAPAGSQTPPLEYKLQPEDIMRISVWGEPNLATELTVDPKGYASIPLVGQIYVEGLTQQDVIDRIAKGLSDYLVEPKVQIAMLRFRMPKVHVLGQVSRPGVHEMKWGDRVMEAIAQAGSFTDIAYLEGSTLTHASNESVPLDLRALFYGGDMSKNLRLEDGDTIYIPEDTLNWYYVLGEVLRPGRYRLKENLNVMDAMSTAGGPTQRGSLKGTCVVRGDPKNPQRIKVDISKMIKSANLAQNIKLQQGDVIFVPETSRPDWNRIASVISAIVNSSYLLRTWGM